MSSSRLRGQKFMTELCDVRPSRIFLSNEINLFTNATVGSCLRGLNLVRGVWRMKKWMDIKVTHTPIIDSKKTLGRKKLYL